MTSEEAIQKGKEILRQKGIVAEITHHEGQEIHPTVPGLGGMGRGTTFQRNRDALSNYFIKTRLIGEHFTPDTSLTLFGKHIAFPILSAPMSGIKSNLRGHIEEKDLLSAIFKGCKEAGTIGIGGDSFDSTSNYIIPDLVKEIGGIGICKPRNFPLLKERLEKLIASDAIAIGIDIDGIARMLINTSEVTRKSTAELKELRALWKGPMILKGILNVEDAVAAHEIGFDAIVVSNHGGRTIDYALATADILPAIAKELKGKIKILVDGGIRTGYDVFMYLALGADAVLIGRSILYSAVGGGDEGVKTTLLKYAADLKVAMLYSGAQNLSEINSTLIERYAKL